MSTFAMTQADKVTGFNTNMASREWAERPDDERFATSEELREHLQQESLLTRDITQDLKALRWIADQSGQPTLDGAYLSNWAFDQTSSLIKVPADYMRRLGEANQTQLLIDNLNTGLSLLDKDESEKRVLARVEPEGKALIRAVNGRNFGRIFDRDMIDRIIEMEGMGWKIPPARPAREGQKGTRLATERDVIGGKRIGGLSINVGDQIAPAGTYYGDRSSFYIRVHDGNGGGAGDGIEVNGQQLLRMVIVKNSEVGAGYWEMYLAYLVAICGNHILHGVQDLKQLHIRHVGAALAKAEQGFQPALLEDGEDTRSADAEVFRLAKQRLLGPGKAEVIESLYDKRISTKRVLDAAWLRAEQHESWYGQPNTAWAMSMGMTEVSQEARWMDQRQQIDEAAAKVLRLGVSV